MKEISLLVGFLFFRIVCVAQFFDAEVITHQTDIEINNNKLSKTCYFEIKINNRAGEKYTQITIPYSKLSKLKNIDAYIKDAQGRTVKKLKKSEITTRSSISDFSFYEDDLTKEFTLKHNSYPYTIVYSYQIQQDEFLYLDYWTPVIDEGIPAFSANLNVSVPQNYGISYLNLHIGDCTVDTIDEVINYQWATSYTDLLEHEIYAPPISELIPSVVIVPKEFRFDTNGSFKDWVSYGNWQFELLQGLNELPENDKIRIATIIQNTTSKKEKIRKLYHYLQDETRYINITIETGGLKPYPASYVSQNKYGDCKALTNYFKSVLDFLEIPSFYTKVYAGNPIKKIDKNFPSQQFNHVILYIPLENEDIWLDCTSDGAFNYLGTFTQNRDAFVVDYNNSHFVKTPSLKPDDVLNTRNIVVHYNPSETSVAVRNNFKGEFYESLIQIERSYNDSEQEQIIRNYVSSDGFQLTDYTISAPNRDSVNIELNYNATSQNLFKHYGNDILVNNIAFPLPNFEPPTVRKLPVQIDLPVFNIDTVIYEKPVGYELHKSNDYYTVSNKYGEFEFSIYEDDENVTIIKNLLIHPGYYPISEYDEFYAFYNKIFEIENKTHLSFIKN